MSGTQQRRWLTGLALLLLLLALTISFRKGGTSVPKAEEIPRTATKSREAREHGTRGRIPPMSKYSEGCARGMSLHEVEEILDRFEETGLEELMTSKTPEERLELRRKAHAWYLQSLVEGLDLSDGQQAVARERLDTLFDEAATEFRKAVEKNDEDPGSRGVSKGNPLRRFVAAQSWMTDDAYAPWALCELTEQQLGITWHGWLQEERKSNLETGDDPAPWFNLWIRSAKLPEVPGIIGIPKENAPVAVGDAGAIFPLHPRQNFQQDPAKGMAGEASALHPAQLRTFLLLSPEEAPKLRKSLPQGGK
jgi:hypothetical protein